MATMNAYFLSYQKTASSILNSYAAGEPFAQYIKKFFKQHSKHGSRDRRIISDLCYGYFRIGKSADKYLQDDQIQIGFFLTHQADNGYLGSLKPAWVDNLGDGLAKKVLFINSIYPLFDFSLIFPIDSPLSADLNLTKLTSSLLNKPSYFIRIRPGKKDKVEEGLNKESIPFETVMDNCLRISNNSNIENAVELNRDCVVQDISSQRTSMLLPKLGPEKFQVWDACAASGGKSIMIHDHYPKSELYVSDIRDTILDQLKLRFKQASIRASNIFKADLIDPYTDHIIRKSIPKSGFELILADVPCSGSGTWGRSPEWLRNFKLNDLAAYQLRQINIIKRLIPFLKPKGYLLYITCSVFKMENEMVVENILENSTLKLVDQQFISGIDDGGDHLFAALFTL